ncbi:hypothetical protein GF373_17585 [bacterium]|nr:hypothetical protein [bacterium]
MDSNEQERTYAEAYRTVYGWYPTKKDVLYVKEERMERINRIAQGKTRLDPLGEPTIISSCTTLEASGKVFRRKEFGEDHVVKWERYNSTIEKWEQLAGRPQELEELYERAQEGK